MCILKTIILIILVFMPIKEIALHAQDNELDKLIGDRDERMEWWIEARYGMFIHWGPYAVLAGEYKGEKIEFLGEWIMQRARIPVQEYRAMAAGFSPEKFNADNWVQTAKAAGMKYIIITAKHCDGFAMYDSDVTDYNIHDWTGFGRDVIMELKEACNRYGLKLGFYYSQNWDWDHPDAKGLMNDWDYPDTGARDPERYYRNKCYPQVRELVEKYDPDIMWFDVPTDITREQSIELLKIVRKHHPNIIVNDRISHEHFEKRIDLGDYLTPEQFVPAEGNTNFETCMTLNDTWGYKSDDNNWKTAGDVIKNLVSTASLGGNYLLNVGPDASGTIPSPSVDVLKEAGDWLDRNGESIYGSEKSPLGIIYHNKAKCTHKPGKLFIHLFELPPGDKLIIGDIQTKVKKIYFLADKEHTPLKYKHTADNDLIIHFNRASLPNAIFADLLATMVIEYEGNVSQKGLAQIVDPSMNASFSPEYAQFAGNCSYGLNDRWDEQRGFEMLEWNTDGRMSWPFRTLNRGKYRVVLSYGADDQNKGNEVVVIINGQSLRKKITEAPGWYENAVVDLGTVELEEGVNAVIQISLWTSYSHTAINFHELKLLPVQ